MKSANDILNAVRDELSAHLDRGLWAGNGLHLYNKALGDTSFLLAGLLDALLKERVPEWDSDVKWLDDCLITALTIDGKKILLYGVMIWGKQGTTSQWIDPFTFELEPLFDADASISYRFRFCDSERPTLTYEEYKKESASVADWESIGWKYIVESGKFGLTI